MVNKDVLDRLARAREKKSQKEKKPLNKGTVPKGYSVKTSQRSEKMKGVMAALAPLYDRFLSTRPDCEVRTEVCTGPAVCVHHVKGRGIKVILDDKYWKAVCLSCHDRLHRNDEESRENGHLKSRLKKSDENGKDQ